MERPAPKHLARLFSCVHVRVPGFVCVGMEKHSDGEALHRVVLHPSPWISSARFKSVHRHQSTMRHPATTLHLPLISQPTLFVMPCLPLRWGTLDVEVLLASVRCRRLKRLKVVGCAGLTPQDLVLLLGALYGGGPFDMTLEGSTGFLGEARSMAESRGWCVSAREPVGGWMCLHLKG